ncbi:MAG: pilus assembly protein PilM [Spirochaetes bacterium]|nr:pilus assembly protein PilM [Spirochaetota bacterium]
MFENIAAIDIGTSSIKIVTVKTGMANFQVKGFIYEDIDADSSPESIKSILGRLISENDLKDYKILTSLPMQKTIIRNLSFPFSDREKIAEALPFEAEEILPFDLQDMVIDFQVVGSRQHTSGNVLMAAALKKDIQNEISFYNETGLNPYIMNMEAHSVFECYRYFNKVADEAVLQIDIGYSKTILNIINNNSLLFTRSIPIGMKKIFASISKESKESVDDIIKIFRDFELDLNSFDNNLQKDYQKQFKIKKTALKSIYNAAVDQVSELIEQITISKMAFSDEHPETAFSRVIISGGGSNITGIGTLISRELELPVISLPFLEEYTETKVRNQLATVFGLVLSYLNRKNPAISFLQNEFLPEASGFSFKQLYVGGFFILLTLLVLFTNLTTTSYLKSESNEQYNEILNKKFQKYFRVSGTIEDPVAEASRLLKEEKKEFESIDSLIHSNARIMDTLNDMLSLFPEDESFELRNFVLNESIIRLDGSIGSSINIDTFKNKLIESKKFENVTLNTNIKKGNEVRFSMTIKLKTTGTGKKS